MANSGNSEDDTTVSETRIVTDVCYDKNKKLWQVVASIAKQHNYDDIFYLAENSNNYGDTILITVGNNLSKRIKTFNINRELILIPVHFIVCVTVHVCEVKNYEKSSI